MSVGKDRNKLSSENILSLSEIAQIKPSQCDELVRKLDDLRQSISNCSPSAYQVMVDLALQACRAFYDSLHEEERLQEQLLHSKERSRALTSQLKIILEELKDSENRDMVRESSICTGTGEDREDALANEAWERFEAILHARLSAVDDEGRSIRDGTEGQQNIVNDADVVNRQTTDRSMNLQAPGYARISMVVHMLGSFRVNSGPEKTAKKPKGKGKQILKYLIVNRHSLAPKEVLMELFWPHHDINSARNNLNVAIYGLRKAFKDNGPTISYILFKEGGYQINPIIDIWVDTERFENHIRSAKTRGIRGSIIESINEYKKAQALYLGDFLADDLYEDWIEDIRHKYKEEYISVLKHLGDYSFQKLDYENCVSLNKKLVENDACDEKAHQRLMSSYNALGMRHLVPRQFNLCKKALSTELGLEPGPETLALFKKIIDGDHEPGFAHRMSSTVRA